MISLDWETLRLLPGADRLQLDGDNPVRLKYTALDPAIEIFTCRCRAPDCQVRALRSFREHIARLYRAIHLCDVHALFDPAPSTAEGWAAVTYPLQMAASLTDAFADTSYVDDSDTALWCEAVANAEELHSEIAAKYIAGLVSFNFLWSAYEASISVAGRGKYPRDSTTVRARKLLLEFADLSSSVPTADKLLRIAEYCCRRWPSGIQQYEQLKTEYSLSGLGAACELCRLFRNHIAHGDDQVPSAQGDWNFPRKGGGDANFAVYRFYTVGRLLLLLVQVLALTAIPEPKKARRFSQGVAGNGATPIDILTTLHLNESKHSLSLA